jgi:hypothetical protein
MVATKYDHQHRGSQDSRQVNNQHCGGQVHPYSALNPYFFHLQQQHHIFIQIWYQWKIYDEHLTIHYQTAMTMTTTMLTLNATAVTTDVAVASGAETVQQYVEDKGDGDGTMKTNETYNTNTNASHPQRWWCQCHEDQWDI